MLKDRSIHITDSQFEGEVLKGEGISIVDFWAPWCGPCVAMVPALEAFARENEEKIKVFKLDVDDNPKTAEKYRIKSVPTIIFFKDGKPVETTTGTLSKSALQEILDKLLEQN